MEGPARVVKAASTAFALAPTLEGKTRTDFELVVARYDEDIRWTDAYAAFRTVYNKGSPDICGESVILPNRGHLADTILHHIVERYDSLATTTFFAHGSVNYRDDQHFPEHTWMEFCRVGPSRLQFIEETQMPSPRGRVYGYPVTWDEAHQQLFGAPMFGRFSWGRGKWVAVGRERIRARPKAFWARWLAWVNAPMPDGSEPTQEDYRKRGVYIERFFVKALQAPARL